MPVLSEAGSDRNDILRNAGKYTLEFDTVGAKAIAQVPAHNRNIKLNLVTEAFFHKSDPAYNINDYEHYNKTDRRPTDTVSRIIDILRMPDSREIFGLTYRDLIEMDEITLEYVYDIVDQLNQQRIQAQKEQEKQLNALK